MAENITRMHRRQPRQTWPVRWEQRAGLVLHSGMRAAVGGLADTMRGGSLRTWLRNALCLFLLTNASLPDGGNPFAVAAFTALLGTGWGAPSAFVGCVLGVAVRWDIMRWMHWWQVPACAAIWMAYPFWRGPAERFPLRAALVAGTVMLVPLPFLMDGLAAERIVCVLGCVVAAAMAPAFHQTLALLHTANRALRTDEQFSALLALLALVLGASVWKIWYMNLGYALAVCVTLWLAQGVGAAAGMVTGGALGMGLLLTGTSPWLCAALAMGGATAGALRTRRRWLCAAAFWLGAGCTSLGILGTWTQLLPLLSVGLGMAAYLLVPERTRLAALRCFEGAGDASGIQPEAVCTMLAYALESRVRSLKAMAGSLPEAQVVPMRAPDRLERLAASHCSGCSQHTMCWNANFESTSLLLTNVLEVTEEREIHPNDIIRTVELIGCQRAERLPEVLADLLQEEQRLLAEQARQNEARALAGVQMDGLAQCLDGVARSLREQVEFLPLLKKRAQRALAQAGLPGEVLVFSRTQGKLEALVAAVDRSRMKETSDVLSRAAGTPLRPRLEESMAELEVLFEQETPLEVEIGISVRPKHGQQVAGDSHLVQRLTGGRQLLALSDGMGSGEKAQSESRATLLLLAQCLRAGYSRTQALAAVNGLLLSCAGEEMFATMDLCVLDLHSGEAAFEKLGACTSYVLRGGDCRPIAGETLPLGILSNVQPRSFRLRLKEGDLVVLVSDGIADGFPGGEDGLRQVLEKLHALPTQAISDALLQRALQNQGEQPLDDMTVLCARVQAQVLPSLGVIRRPRRRVQASRQQTL